jgi:hypothetical protein
MGLAASQARLLLSYARKSDLEYRVQIISQRRMLLSYTTEKLANEYGDALSNRKMIVKQGDNEVDLTVGQLMLLNLKPKFRADGSDVPENLDSKLLQQAMRDGTIYLNYIVVPQGETADKQVDWRTCSSIIDTLDSGDDERASAIWEAETSKVQQQDKRLELESKNYETQHKAVETEIDAIQKVIDKNIEKSFKTLG